MPRPALALLTAAGSRLVLAAEDDLLDLAPARLGQTVPAALAVLGARYAIELAGGAQLAGTLVAA